jgi:RHS repeat-associated protein
VRETTGTDTIDYFYDENGNLYGLKLNGAEYYYIRNGQNDIIDILDFNGDVVVSYSYDTWGKLLSITGILADTVGVKNPYRYRGYMYDTETGLYYLQSRYYDPEIGRWINADIMVDNGMGILGTNMYGYCINNPVNMIDDSGEIPKWIVDIANISFSVLSTMNRWNSVKYYTIKTAIAYMAARSLSLAKMPLTSAMFLHAMYGGGKDLYLSINSSSVKEAEANL